MLVTIHGHFYQPPRENPWSGEIPRQEGAAPFHDWNERIQDECYAPNGRSRVLDADGHITAIVNNFSTISFDFGPTLLRDLARRFPYVYRRILEADRESAGRKGGHGNALAQAYNHMILPLANYRDKWTQVRWGLRDFEYRFGRTSEGLWLPETACDAETLEVVSQAGIRFLILAPRQALRTRKMGEKAWKPVSEDHPLDLSRPYRCYAAGARGPESRWVDVFFYNGSLAVAASFEHLLRSASDFADRLEAAGRGLGRNGLVHLATDGEVYGHHEPFADMCLAYLFRHEGPARGMEFLNYAEFLDRHPPEHEVELDFTETGEGTSWSCAHGVGRWIRDCGCSTGGEPGWNQRWRAPLRRGLDALRDQIQNAYVSLASPYLRDPWAARDDYIEVLLQPDPDTREKLLARHLRGPVDGITRQMIWSLLEANHQGMLMYTSCAWFFADISGLEVQQNLAYALRACELAQPYVSLPLEPLLLRRLEQARSNLPAWGDGAQVFRRTVQPRRLRPEQAAAQAAFEAASLGEPLPRAIHCYRVKGSLEPAGEDGSAGGRLCVRDPLVEQSWCWSFRVSPGSLEKQEVSLTPAVDAEASAAPYPARLTLRDLWEETRAAIAERVLGRSLHEEIEQIRNIYERARAPMTLLLELGLRVPEVHSRLGRYVLNDRFRDLARPILASAAPLPEDWWQALSAAVDEDRRLTLNCDVAPVTRALTERIHALLDLALAETDREQTLRQIQRAYDTLARADLLQLPLTRSGIEPRTYDLVLRFREELAEPPEGGGVEGETTPVNPLTALRHLAGHANLKLQAILIGGPSSVRTGATRRHREGRKANA